MVYSTTSILKYYQATFPVIHSNYISTTLINFKLWYVSFYASNKSKVTIE